MRIHSLGHTSGILCPSKGEQLVLGYSEHTSYLKARELVHEHKHQLDDKAHFDRTGFRPDGHCPYCGGDEGRAKGLDNGHYDTCMYYG